jgi:putative transposase
MNYNPHRHHRRSIRLRGYDYSQKGAYFVTICTHKKECLFGEVIRGKMHLNKYGILVAEEWEKTSQIRDNVELDTFIVMPNHLDGIIWITLQNIPNENENTRTYCRNKTLYCPPQSLGAIVRGFKGATTKLINKMYNFPSIPLWQRNYYESIIRTEKGLDTIRHYILNNPVQWDLDREKI